MTETSTDPAPDEVVEETPPGTGPDPDAVSEPPEPQTIDEVDLSEHAIARVETPAGSLTLRPNQKALDPEQHAALLAIGIDTQTDPGIIPHLRAFVHMCQIRGLDPFAREAYLIGRGRGENRKYTMQTGIDGYRKMANSTGRFLRVKRVLWTGRDDDDRSFREVIEDGDVIMRRVWYDQWPEAKGHPGAAKVVVEHLDSDGQITTTSAVANWEMYAAYKDRWENRQKVIDPETRKPVQDLNDMWTKGGPHMLSKCAEALAYRQAFPAAMSGIYVTEEMTRLDQEERNKRESRVVTARQEAYAARHEVAGEQAAPEPTEEPAAAADVVEEAAEHAVADSAAALAALRSELDWQAEVMGRPAAALANRWVSRYRKNLPDFDATELLAVVSGLREMVSNAAASQSHPQADAYQALVQSAAGAVIDMSTLVDVIDVQDPDEPHPYEAHGGGDDHEVCYICGLGEDVGPHDDPEEKA